MLAENKNDKIKYSDINVIKTRFQIVTLYLQSLYHLIVVWSFSIYFILTLSHASAMRYCCKIYFCIICLEQFHMQNAASLFYTSDPIINL